MNLSLTFPAQQVLGPIVGVLAIFGAIVWARFRAW